MKYLIGNSGLVGKNLLKHEQFAATFNSSNIHTFNEKYIDGNDLVLSCLPATKWQVNKNKLQDIQNIQNIANILAQHKFAKIVLISTIDVYLDSPLYVDESYDPNIKSMHYGTHRLLFEKIVRDMISYDSLYIVRLPALFGDYLKKNVLYDLINNNCVENINTNSYYQWYNLNRLNSDLSRITATTGGIFNLFTQPIYTADIVHNFFASCGATRADACVRYDWRTQHNDTGYTQSSQEVMQDIEKFIHETRNKQSC